MKTIFQSAQDNWPEDEAAAILDFWADAPDYTPQEVTAKIEADAKRMEGFFMKESDGPELVARFRARLAKENE